MTPERWQEVERVYHAALARPAAARAAFVREACAGDEALRAEVESLLSQEGASAFLETPAAAAAGSTLTSSSPSLVGRSLGSYQITAVLGAGGMGEVYRARDTTLGRDVAIKVLPAIFTADAERLARFEREARVLASLNHPHIGAIYAVEAIDPSTLSGQTAGRALVLELVEGPTLADRLERGPLPVREALTLATQIAEALEAAHEKGIVHRDLKPSNVVITPAGVVKVLDFGLAKASGPADVGAGFSRPDESPTLTVGGTRDGMLLGTAAYMSPEQARGQVVDKRTDIWAFGCVLYEMLTGRVAFPGATVTDTLAAVIRAEPDWGQLAEAPPAIRRLLRRCLEKDPRERLHDIGDARWEIKEALAAPVETAAPAGSIVVSPRPGGLSSAWVAWSAAAVVLVAAIVVVAMMYPRQAPSETRVYRSTILLPAALAGLNPAARLALSPDGRRLAFVASNATGRPLVWVRPLDGLVAQPLAGTEGASAPFWSPDSRAIAFFSGGKLKRIDASGGPASELCDVVTGDTPGTRSRDDVILFTATRSGPISRVGAAGGTPSPATSLDMKVGETLHFYPFFLPDGRHFLYSAVAGGVRPSVYVGSLDSTDRTRLLDGGSNAQYAQGFLFFLRATTVMAQRFDLTRLAFTGEAKPVAERVQVDAPEVIGRGGQTAGAFSVSATGVLVYQGSSQASASQLVWFDRAGKQTGVVADRADYADVFLSPDGTHVSVSVAESGTAARDIWDVDVVRGLRTRFTFDPDDEFEAPWSPDGSRRVFNSRRKGHLDLYQKAASGVGGDELLFADGLDKFAQSWSRDGRFILYVAIGATTGQDVWVLSVLDRKAVPFLQTKFGEGTPQFSPDGRWIAYRSNESQSGQMEVYVAPFRGPAGKWQVSTAGGQFPRWRRDGKEIFYVVPGTNKLMAAEVNGQGAGFEVGAVRPLFDLRPRVPRWFYDVSPDGRRFLVNTVEELGAAAPITVVVNWPAPLNNMKATTP